MLLWGGDGDRQGDAPVPPGDGEEENPDVVTFAAVRELALALPRAEEGTSYGTPAFRVRGRLFARLREEGDVLVVRVEPAHREFLTLSQPAVYFVTPHYEKYPYVLVRLADVDREELRALLADAWRLVAPKRLAAGFDTGGPAS